MLAIANDTAGNYNGSSFIVSSGKAYPNFCGLLPNTTYYFKIHNTCTNTDLITPYTTPAAPPPFAVTQFSSIPFFYCVDSAL